MIFPFGEGGAGGLAGKAHDPLFKIPYLPLSKRGKHRKNQIGDPIPTGSQNRIRRAIMEKLSFAITTTAWGYVALAAGKHGLRHLILPLARKQQAFEALAAALHGETLSPDEGHALLRSLVPQIKAYFQGQQVEFKLKLDYDVGTVFQREVWCVARTIAYGQTRTYGWIAEKLGDPDARRAVGQALHANPLPLVVPCHRVVASRGRLGGFSGGAEMKSRLLKLEHAILT